MSVPTGQTPESTQDPTRVFRREDLQSYPSYAPNRPTTAPNDLSGPQYDQQSFATGQGHGNAWNSRKPAGVSPWIPALLGIAGVGVLGLGLWLGFGGEEPDTSPTPTQVTADPETTEPESSPSPEPTPEESESPEPSVEPSPTPEASPTPEPQPSPTWSGIGRRPELPDYPLEVAGYSLEDAQNEFRQDWRAGDGTDGLIFVNHSLYDLEWMSEGFSDLSEFNGYMCGHGSLDEFSCFIETSDGTTEIYGFYASEQAIIDFTSAFAGAWLG